MGPYPRGRNDFPSDEKILCTGDSIVNGPYNYTGDGVGGAHENGTKLKELVSVEDGAGVQTTVTLSDDVRNWVAGRIAEQIRLRYAERAEGKPIGEILRGPQGRSAGRLCRVSRLRVEADQAARRGTDSAPGWCPAVRPGAKRTLGTTRGRM